MPEAETPTTTRAPGAVRDSLIASAAGFAFSVLLTECIFYSRFAFYFGTFLAPWIANICNTAASLVGWLLIILPLSLAHRPARWSNNIALTSILAAAVGFTITFLETLPLAGFDPRVLTPPLLTMREFYIAAGVINASTAAVCLIALRRTAARRNTSAPVAPL